MTTLAPTANRKDFTSPFPIPSSDSSSPSSYDEGLLLDALGRVSVGLSELQKGGLIGHWEISIPEDDDWNVVTVAVDDDSTIGGQILSRERGQPLDGSPVNAMVRAAMDDTAKVSSSYKMDVFFIDPTTTKQELYNPTQLLISLSDLLGQWPASKNTGAVIGYYIFSKSTESTQQCATGRAGRLLRMGGIRNTKPTQIGCCHCSCWDGGRFNLLSPFFHDQILRHITTISQQNDLNCIRIEHVDGIQCRLSSCV